MRRLVWLSVYRYKVDDFYKDLCRIYPEGHRVNRFECELMEDDSRLSALLELLEQHGMRSANPVQYGFDHNEDTFRLQVERLYNKEDFDHISYMVLYPQVRYGYSQTSVGTDSIQLDARDLRGGADVAVTILDSIIVSDGFKRAAELSQLQHLIFKPAEVLGPGRERVQEPFWELTSNIVLPHLSSTCQLVNSRGEPFNEKLDIACTIVEDNQKYPELHYSDSSLSGMAQFDLAYTFERFRPLENRLAVGSRKLYELCEEQKWNIKWIPVRSDPD